MPSGVKLFTPNSFIINSALTQYDHCNYDTVFVYVDKFGPDSDFYLVKGVKTPGVEGVVHNVIEGAFRDKIDQVMTVKMQSPVPIFGFEIPLVTGKEVFAEEEISATCAGASVRYHIKMIHTPG